MRRRHQAAAEIAHGPKQVIFDVHPPRDKTPKFDIQINDVDGQRHPQASQAFNLGGSIKCHKQNFGRVIVWEALFPEAFSHESVNLAGKYLPENEANRFREAFGVRAEFAV